MDTSNVSRRLLQYGPGLSKVLPEPKNRLGTSFQSILNGVGGALGGVASNALGVDVDYASLLNRQIEIQQQMQLVSMESNIEKSKHETRMAAVRNVRAS